MLDPAGTTTYYILKSLTRFMWESAESVSVGSLFVLPKLALPQKYLANDFLCTTEKRLPFNF